VVLDRLGLRCRARVSFEWYPDGTAHCDWIPYMYPSYYGFPRIGGSMTRATPRYDVSWMSELGCVNQRGTEPRPYTRGISFLRLFANSFCEFMMPATYDAGHHNFEFPPTLPPSIWQFRRRCSSFSAVTCARSRCFARSSLWGLL
jgi:hypothetical protein